MTVYSYHSSSSRRIWSLLVTTVRAYVWRVRPAGETGSQGHSRSSKWHVSIRYLWLPMDVP